MQANIMKSAMRSGLILGVLFSVNFLLSIPANTVTSLLTYVVIAAILVATYRLSVQIRDNEYGGYIKYGKAFSFILLSFFYAAIISAFVKLIYFQFINTEYLPNFFNEYMLALESIGYPVDMIEDTMRTLFKPASFSFLSIFANILVGTLVGLIMSAFVKKEKSIFEE